MFPYRPGGLDNVVEQGDPGAAELQQRGIFRVRERAAAGEFGAAAAEEPVSFCGCLQLYLESVSNLPMRKSRLFPLARLRSNRKPQSQ
jgi:hypothetical protein